MATAESSRSRQHTMSHIASTRKPAQDVQRDERELERLVNKQSPSITSHDSTEAGTPDDEQPLMPYIHPADKSFYSYDRKGKRKEVATPKPKSKPDPTPTPKSILVVRNSEDSSRQHPPENYETPRPGWSTLSRMLEVETKPKSTQLTEYETPESQTGSKGLLRFEYARVRLAERLSEYDESPIFGSKRARAQASHDNTYLPTHDKLPSTTKKNVTFRERPSFSSYTSPVSDRSARPLDETSRGYKEETPTPMPLPSHTPHKSRTRERSTSRQRSASSEGQNYNETSRAYKEETPTPISLPSSTPHKSRSRENSTSHQRSTLSESQHYHETSHAYREESPNPRSRSSHTPYKSRTRERSSSRQRSAPPESQYHNEPSHAYREEAQNPTPRPSRISHQSSTRERSTSRQRSAIDQRSPAVSNLPESLHHDVTSRAYRDTSPHPTSLPSRTRSQSRSREGSTSRQRSPPSESQYYNDTSQAYRETSPHPTSLPAHTPHKSSSRERSSSRQRSAIDSRSPAVSVPAESQHRSEPFRPYKEFSSKPTPVPPRTPHQSRMREKLPSRPRYGIDSRSPIILTPSRIQEIEDSDEDKKPHRSDDDVSERQGRRKSRDSTEEPIGNKSKDSAEQPLDSSSKDLAVQPFRSNSRDAVEEPLHSNSKDSAEQPLGNKNRDSSEQPLRSNNRDSAASTSPHENSARKSPSLPADPATPNLSVLTKTQYTPLQNVQMPSSKLQDVDISSTESSKSEKFEPDSLHIPEISDPSITASPPSKKTSPPSKKASSPSMKASPCARPAKDSASGTDRPLNSTPTGKATLSDWRADNELPLRTFLAKYGRGTDDTERGSPSKAPFRRPFSSPRWTREKDDDEPNSRYKVKEVHIWRWLGLLALCWLLQSCASSSCIMEATRLEFTAPRNLYNGFHRAQFDNPRHPVQACHDAPQSDFAKSLRMVELSARTYWLKAKYTFVNVPRDPWCGHLKPGQFV